MRIVKECIDEVPALFDALVAKNQDEVIAIKERIFTKEQEADDLEHQLRAHLPKSLFMPVDRRDLLDLLNIQDAIADTAQDIAGLMVERDMSVPPEMEEPLLAMVRRCVDTCDSGPRPRPLPLPSTGSAAATPEWRARRRSPSQ